jgi:hypothetical protein
MNQNVTYKFDVSVHSGDQDQVKEFITVRSLLEQVRKQSPTYLLETLQTQPHNVIHPFLG